MAEESKEEETSGDAAVLLLVSTLNVVCFCGDHFHLQRSSALCFPLPAGGGSAPYQWQVEEDAKEKTNLSSEAADQRVN